MNLFQIKIRVGMQHANIPAFSTYPFVKESSPLRAVKKTNEGRISEPPPIPAIVYTSGGCSCFDKT